MQLVEQPQDDNENQSNTVCRDRQQVAKPVRLVEQVLSQSVSNQHACRAREAKNAVSYTLALLEGLN